MTPGTPATRPERSACGQQSASHGRRPADTSGLEYIRAYYRGACLMTDQPPTPTDVGSDPTHCVGDFMSWGSNVVLDQSHPSGRPIRVKVDAWMTADQAASLADDILSAALRERGVDLDFGVSQ